MPNTDFDQLKRDQVETALRPWRKVSRAAMPRGGWIRVLRDALGMSSRQLAKRMNVTPQQVRKLEKGEAQGSVTLSSLRKAAAALECELVYALVPKKHIEEARRARALALAEALRRHGAHSMKLENQAVTDRQSERQREALVKALLRESPRKLWD